MPDEVTLGHEAGPLGTCGEVGTGKAVAALLVGVAHNDRRVAPGAQHTPQLAEHAFHALEVLGVRLAVGDVGRLIADHRIVGAPVGEAFGQPPAGHRLTQLGVVRRVGGDEVDRFRLELDQQRHGVADDHSAARRVEPARATGIRTSEIGQTGLAIAAPHLGHDLPVHVGPALFQLEAQGPTRRAADGRSQERTAHAGEWVEDQLTGLREELDQARHQPWRLVRTVGFP